MKLTTWAAAALLIGSAGAASAHHSFAMFDANQTVTLDGTVKEFEWVNPHSWLHVDAAGKDGKVTLYSIEMGGPGSLYRAGWRQENVRPGDRIEVQMHPLRDGRPGGSLVSAKLSNGQVLGERAAPAPAN